MTWEQAGATVLYVLAAMFALGAVMVVIVGVLWVVHVGAMIQNARRERRYQRDRQRMREGR